MILIPNIHVMSSLDYHSDSENDRDAFTHSWVKKFYFDHH